METSNRMMTGSLKKITARTVNKVLSFNFTNYSNYHDPKSVLLKYWDYESNWGDSVNKYLVEKLTGRPVVSSNRVFNYLKKPELLGVGSIITGDLSNYVIWGSGISSEKTKVVNAPLKVLALRGLKTYERLKPVGVKCNIFGDPVLLFPEIFKDKHSSKKYRYGIIPHYKEKDHPVIDKIKMDDSIIVLDIQQGIEEFASAVLSCENIVSSSLHGLILAESYGIPTCRIKFSDKILSGDFKYQDYYSAVKLNLPETIGINEVSDLKKAFDHCSLKDLRFDGHLLKQALLEYLQNEK